MQEFDSFPGSDVFFFSVSIDLGFYGADGLDLILPLTFVPSIIRDRISFLE